MAARRIARSCLHPCGSIEPNRDNGQRRRSRRRPEVRVDPADPGSVATPEATCAEIASLGWSLDVFSDERVWTVRVRARSHGEDVAAEQPTEGSGLEAARRDPPDRIICDIALPGASGDTFLTDSTNWHVRS
jgi:CheY-like chemotaxis protein